jgi:DNA-binding response OmpR family regulator
VQVRRLISGVGVVCALIAAAGCGIAGDGVRVAQEGVATTAPVPDERTGPLRFGTVEIDPDGVRVVRDGEPVTLTPTEMRLLLRFAESPGTVLSRDILLESVWNYQWGGDSRVVDVHVQRLRNKIGGDLIETVRGFGYKLSGDVR